MSGDVWLDADHDRVFSPPGFGIGRGSAQDQPLGGWTVEVLLGGSVLATTTSGIDGGWEVTGLLPGPGYAVRFRHPVTGTIFGNPVSTFPGATTDNGEIAGLLLAPGSNIVGQSLPLDPSGVAYNSVTRMPVEGTAVVIEGPAGFDELIHLPPGQQGQVTAPDGYYQFDLLAGFPAGVYTLTFTPPVGYLPTFPSGILPPQAGPLDPTGGGDPFLVAVNNGAPTGGDPTDYFVSFDLAPGDPNVVNNHVALDPVLEGSIAISKRTPKRNVVRGELVPYTLEVRNLLSVPLPGMEVIDILPPGFKYIAGSAQVDGLNIEPDVTGRQLVWPGITFTPGQVREISLVTVIGAGVGDGRYVNTARAIEPFSRTLLSNVAEAEIYVVPDPIFDCTDIIGKVFDDRNGNGYQDEGEPGLAGVRLRTVRGLVVTTDAYGRYHIACPELAHDLRGSNFIVKVDERSLPTGYRMTSENPRVIRLTRGKIVEADFGAAIGRVLRLELADGAFVRPAGTDEKADREALDEGWIEAFRMVFEEVEGGRAVLRLGYVATDEPRELIDIRLANALEAMEGLWSEKEGRAPLEVEREVLRIARAERPAEVSLDGAARNVETAEADERGIAPPASLSLDGVQSGGLDDAPGANAQRRADVALSAADIRVQADGLQVDRQLNVVASPNSAPRSGELVFSTWCNYGAFVERSELRIFADDASASGEPLRVVPMGAAGVLRMAAAELDGDRFLYVLRAYGGEGRFDETEPKVLRIIPDTAFSMEAPLDPTEVLVGYGESHLARADIPVQGGSVTVSGREVPEGARVFVGGQEIPVTDQGVFVTQLILGEGTHDVAVRLDGVDGTILDAERRVMFPKDEWFFVAIADLTVGGGSTSGPAALVTGDDQYDDDVWVNGRVAMHLKGKIKGEHLLTMSFDTGDRPLDEIFDGLDDRDPRTLLRYVDPDQTYPVYGDDSTTSWDAPTQGRFYVRLERDDYKVLWGNFKTQILDTDLAQIDRGLYGFQGQYRSRARTESGEIRTTLDGFAAAPDSAAAREELRGTGGSLYYLRHRDLMIGSERVRIEVRDKDSGLVLDVRNLTPQQDYDVDYLAGRILLTSPLASTAADGFAVQNSSLAGNPVYLVARYEFTPSGTDLDALDVGGRVSHWMSDSVRVGLTIDHREETGGDRDLQAVDVTWRFGGNSYLKAEVANSEGPGSEELTSLDGGFTYGSAAGGLNDGSDGSAARIEGAFDLKESGIGFLEGRLTGMVQRREAGFSGTGQSTQGASTQASLSLTEPLGEKTSLRVEFDMRDEDLRTSQRAVDAQLEHQINEEWGLLAGLRLDDVDAGVLSGLGARNGRRADLGLRLEYGGFERGSVYVFGQATVDRTGGRRANNRYGIGGDYILTEKLKVDGELSGGNGGVGVRVGTELSVTDRTDLYLAYGLDADRSDTGLGAQTGRRNGTLTAGAKHRYSETLSLFGEERYQHGDGPAGLTHAYGAEYSPNDRWTGGLLMENGQLSEGGETTIERTGVSVNAGYVKEKTRVASAVEWRDDQIAGGDRTTWLTRNTIGYQTTPDWRMLAGVDIARSDSENGSTFDADYTELTLGWAHRPVDHERWNALFRYSYHEDLPSPGQVGAFGGGVDFAQRSHVLSADANYDVSRWVTVGGKVGVRHGELKPTRDAGVWFDSTAVLYALRADLHVVKKWDALLEARFLDVEAAEDQRAGVLASVSRHVGENGKIGVGYNFADFSDNLTDLDYDHQGWFFNLVGKF